MPVPIKGVSSQMNQHSLSSTDTKQLNHEWKERLQGDAYPVDKVKGQSTENTSLSAESFPRTPNLLNGVPDPKLLSAASIEDKPSSTTLAPAKLSTAQTKGASAQQASRYATGDDYVKIEGHESCQAWRDIARDTLARNEGQNQGGPSQPRRVPHDPTTVSEPQGSLLRNVYPLKLLIHFRGGRGIEHWSLFLDCSGPRNIIMNNTCQLSPALSEPDRHGYVRPLRREWIIEEIVGVNPNPAGLLKVLIVGNIRRNDIPNYRRIVRYTSLSTEINWWISEQWCMTCLERLQSSELLPNDLVLADVRARALARP